MKKDVLAEQPTKKRYSKGVVVGLSVATAVLALSTIGLAIAFGTSESQRMDYGVQLENVYQKNMYDLIESVNNVETKLSKVLASNSPTYQKKLLSEVASNTELAQNAVAGLPISQNSLSESVQFINQLGGYSQTLADSLAQGKQLKAADLETIEKLHQSVKDMKKQINEFSKKVQSSYSILNQSLVLDGDYNNFTIEMSKIKGDNMDYPVMIYDGPFSDSTLDKTVKGLYGEEKDKNACKTEIERCFKNLAQIEYSGEINSRFETYAFNVTNTDSQKLFVQVSKIGGHVLTVSGRGSETGEKNIDEKAAEKIAIDFAKENGIQDPQVVWKDGLDSCMYFNLAPTSGSIVLYPDLVKVKVDLGSASVVGYDATSYFMNHTDRKLAAPKLSPSAFKDKLPKSMKVKNMRTVLAPLDYNREIMCFEYECEKNGATYYFYLNTTTGEEENVLKVVQTDDGSKLL